MNPLSLVITILALLAVPAMANGSETFRAQGNEPSWSVRMADDAITFQLIGSNAVTVTPVPRPRQEDKAEIYEAKVGSDSFTLTIRSKVCTDTMSGMPFPKSVTLALGEKTFSGCGGEPATLLLGHWLITEIDGKPAIAGSSPSVTFEAGGKINGNASCNRYFGNYIISGEGLKAGDLGASMMMCEQELMDQETEILKILKSLQGFGIDENGKLILRANDGRTILASPAA